MTGPVAQRRGFARVALLSLLVVGIAAAVHAPRLGKPLDGSLAAATATYHVLFYESFDEAGFVALRGMPCVGFGTTNPAERDPYLHHPVLSYWIGYLNRRLFGWNETAFRLLSFASLLLSAAFVVFLGARLLDPLHGFLAGLVYATLPMTFLYGQMINPEPVVLLFLLGGVLLYERLREAPSPFRRRLFFLWFFVGCGMDWQVYFLCPALVVAELLRPAGTRRFREALLLVPLGCLAFALTVGHFAWAYGDPRALLAHLQETVTRTVHGGEGRPLATFFENQARVLVHLFGWPVIAALAALVVTAVIRPATLRRVPGRLLPALFVPVILNLGVFRTPAFDHDFYWMPALLAVPIAVAAVLRALAHARPLLGCLALLLAFGSNVVLSLQAERLAESALVPWPSLAATLDRLSTPGDLVATPEPYGPASFYMRRRFYDAVDSWEKFEYLLSKRAHFVRFHFFLREETIPKVQPIVDYLEAHAQRVDHKISRMCQWILVP